MSTPASPLKNKKPGVWEGFIQSWQCWALRHPRNLFVRLFLPWIAFVQGIKANQPPYFPRKRNVFGPNFCAAGAVILGEFKAIEEALTIPHARTHRLGQSLLDPDHLPGMPDGNRLTFLLSLSHKECDGNGDFEAFRACLDDYITNQAALDRSKDETAQRLIAKLVLDYKYMEHGRGGDFFTNKEKGLRPFLVRLVHYCLLGMDPFDIETMDELLDLHLSKGHALYYFAKWGNNFRRTCFPGRYLKSNVDKIAKIYESSPVLAGFVSGQAKYNHLALPEFSALVTAIMGIAGLLGPIHLATNVLGGAEFPEYEGQKVHEIDVRKIWDELDLDNQIDVENYILECGRLWMPVSASHHVATKPFTTKILDKEHTFPAGTHLVIPMILGHLDQHFWGDSVHKFDHNRENLCPYSMLFNSVGDRTNGHICPGRAVSLSMISQAVIACGKQRRNLPKRNQPIPLSASVNDMDRYTKTIIKKLVPTLLGRNPILDDELLQPTRSGPQPTNIIKSGLVNFKNHEEDNTFGELPKVLDLMLSALRRDLIFPVKDIIVHIDDQEAEALTYHTRLGEIVPVANVRFQDPQSDQGLTRQAFYGLGAHRVQDVDKYTPGAPPNAAFMLDLSSLARYPIRKGFAKYGGCVYFDVNQKPLALHDTSGTLLLPGDQGWEHAKAVWRVSLLSVVTVVDHLFNLHFGVAAQMLRACVEGLPPDHTLRRALTPFLMRTAFINNMAGASLIVDNSFVEHMTAFTLDALHDMAKRTYRKGPEWKPLSEQIAMKGPQTQLLVESGKLPFFQDGLELYALFRTYFESKIPADDASIASDKDLNKFWVLLRGFTASPDLSKFVTRDALLGALAIFAFQVTAHHDQVGAFSDSGETPLHGGFRMVPGHTRVDKQSYLIGLTLLSLTSLRTPPLLSDFAQYWRTVKEKASWGTLQLALFALSAQVDERNQTRLFPVQNANPRFLECSVSI